MLELRLREGLPVELAEPDRIARCVDDGLLRRAGERVVLTDAGRLLADHVVRTLLA
jgi:oxygen-independent coproporphyrinogen-3 oxidase